MSADARTLACRGRAFCVVHRVHKSAPIVGAEHWRAATERGGEVGGYLHSV